MPWTGNLGQKSPALGRKAGDRRSMRLVSRGRGRAWGLGELSTAVPRRAARAADILQVRLPQVGPSSGRGTPEVGLSPGSKQGLRPEGRGIIHRAD